MRGEVVVVGAGLAGLACALELASADGRTTHGFYYPPTNADFQGVPGTRPPLLVKSHGGPTAAKSR